MHNLQNKQTKNSSYSILLKEIKSYFTKTKNFKKFNLKKPFDKKKCLMMK